MNNGKQGEQLLKVLGGHSASLDRTSKYKPQYNLSSFHLKKEVQCGRGRLQDSDAGGPGF